jgi:hypothetical protein
MGASIIHGRRLEKQFEKLEDGLVACEIVPVEGDYAFPAYSSVERVVAYAESKGIDRDLWPIYYDTPLSDVDLEEVYDRCERLRRAIATLREEDIAADPWLKRMADLLNSGQRFCVQE